MAGWHWGWDKQTNKRKNRQKISPFYNSSAPIGAAAQKNFCMMGRFSVHFSVSLTSTHRPGWLLGWGLWPSNHNIAYQDCKASPNIYLRCQKKFQTNPLNLVPSRTPPLFVKMGKFVNYDFWASTLQASYLHLYCSKFKKLHEVWKGFFKGYNLSLTATF